MTDAEKILDLLRGIENDIAELRAGIDTLTARMTAIEQRVTIIEQHVTEIEGSVTRIESRLERIERRLDTGGNAMIPAKTSEALGSQLWQAKVCEPEEFYSVIGNDLNELKALALRLTDRLDPNEARDWQNRLNLMIDQARSTK